MNTREKFAELEEEQDSIVESVIGSFKQRSDVGIRKYNKTMDRKRFKYPRIATTSTRGAYGCYIVFRETKKEL